MPELKKRYPSARALALYAESPEHGDAWEDARLVEVAEGSAAADGDSISVVALDVPSDIFSRKEGSDRMLDEIGDLVFNRPGYVLGRPMFIQENVEEASDFVMQLAEHVADLNLGDAGALYVFERRTFMQCH